MNIFIDCGTHNFEGFRQLADSYGIDRTWSCFSFEADPNQFKLFASTYQQLLDEGFNLQFYNKAVSSSNGYLKINSCVDYSVGSNVLESRPEWDKDWDHGFSYREETAMVESIDFSEFLRSVATDNDFVLVKMNIEGSEFDVIRSLIDTGAYSLITKFYCEFHERFFEDYDNRRNMRREFESFFENAGIPIIEWIPNVF